VIKLRNHPLDRLGVSADTRNNLVNTVLIEDNGL
jgi:hypothetical protein